MSIFSERLIALRKEREVTQEQLAKILCKKRTTVSGYETEGKEPDYETLAIIAKYFGVSCDYLLGNTDSRTNIDDVLFNDSLNLKKHYKVLKPEQKISVSRIYDDFYSLLKADIVSGCSERLSVYSELFNLLAKSRNEIRAKVSSSGKNVSDPLFISDLMTMETDLKNSVSVLLDKLLQADMEVAFNLSQEGAKSSPGVAM